MSDFEKLVVSQAVAYAVILGFYFGVIAPWMRRRHERRMDEL